MALCAALILGAWTARAETRIVNRRVQPRQTVAKALSEAGLTEPQLDQVISALESVFECRRSRPGDQVRLVFTDGALDFLDYRRSALDEFQVRRDQDRFVASKRVVEVEKRTEVVELDIRSSVYVAAKESGEDPEIALALSDVFAWDIDFYRDVQSGDKARILIEKIVAKGRLLRYGEVLAATYEGRTTGKKRVFRYELPNGERSYFLEDGSSARKTFLKSPLKYAHVTSGFGGRFHPILNYFGAHNGIDFGTPTGTPVWAVADGTVTRAGWDDGGGNMVCLRHVNSMETCYLHLSKFGEGLTQGARVSQKQVIGYSGSTGLSTGPHLHFALKRGGRYVNPLSQNFPRAEPVPKELRDDFRNKVAPLVSQLDATSVAQLR